MDIETNRKGEPRELGWVSIPLEDFLKRETTVNTLPAWTSTTKSKGTKSARVLIRFIAEQLASVSRVILIAHNGYGFDFPTLTKVGFFDSLDTSRIGLVDTLFLAKTQKLVDDIGRPPINYRNQYLFTTFCSETPVYTGLMQNAHTATADATMTALWTHASNLSMRYISYDVFSDMSTHTPSRRIDTDVAHLFEEEDDENADDGTKNK